MKILKALIALIGLSGYLSGCGSDSPSFSLLPSGEVFVQSSNVRQKVDILWVVDNSGSMETSQQNLVVNFPSFINGFLQRDLDFQIAIATTDSFIATYPQIYNAFPVLYGGLPMEYKARFRDGAGGVSSGVFVINNNTPNINQVFTTNSLQGIFGYGDERPFQSMKTTLDSSLNQGFIRSDSFLSIVIISDEDDFSYDGVSPLQSITNSPYEYSGLHTLESYIQYLEHITDSTATQKNFSVNAITIQDQACLESLQDSSQRIGHRIKELAEATGGEVGSICGNFAEDLKLISDNIIQATTKFYLKREPVPSSIVVIVNGQHIPNVSENPGPLSGGWFYDPESIAIVFEGDYTPAAGAQIQVLFDPVSLDL